MLPNDVPQRKLRHQLKRGTFDQSIKTAESQTSLVVAQSLVAVKWHIPAEVEQHAILLRDIDQLSCFGMSKGQLSS